MVAEFSPGPTMDAIGTPDSAPKRRGRPPKDPNAPVVTRRPRASKSLETQIGATLVMVNLPIMAFASGDALDGPEIEALSKAIDAQCKISPTFRKYVAAALEVTAGGQLVGVIGIITARRFARHGVLLPREADAMLGGMLGSTSHMAPPSESDMLAYSEAKMERIRESGEGSDG